MNCRYKCSISRNGTGCYCEDGYEVGDDGRNCKDLDECNVYGTCSQTCINTDGSYACSCVEGYILQPDNKSCKAKNEPSDRPPVLLIASSETIEVLYLNGSKVSTPNSVKGNGINTLDFIYNKDTICWIESRESSSQLKCTKISKAGRLTDEWIINIAQYLHTLQLRSFCAQRGLVVCTRLQFEHKKLLYCTETCQCRQAHREVMEMTSPDIKQERADLVYTPTPTPRRQFTTVNPKQRLLANVGGSQLTLSAALLQSAASDYCSSLQRTASSSPDVASNRLLLRETELNDVQQMAIDWLTGNLYFVDHVSDRIFVCNHNGTVCITLIDLDLQNPKAIAVDPTSGRNGKIT
ncbi:Low-density lipoprotein receptor-related protein 1B [Chelonia mydas]|uniref:Low-density lipoprotein receptor-related protein 1B n=1 Tax=Chelonia mydas TaxID=8469 RepID=M7BQG3_CHEMY|nr:Low-density lipoprotein receptor-related protein 1B [Chelonia mydas]